MQIRSQNSVATTLWGDAQYKNQGDDHALGDRIDVY
jgi:hypothetical protein